MTQSFRFTFTLPQAQAATGAPETPDADFPKAFTQDRSVVDKLGIYKATLFEVLALRFYEYLNGGSWSRKPNTWTVELLRRAGPGFRGAEQITDMIVVFVGYFFIDPRVVGQYEATRGDHMGDFLAFSVILLWFFMAFLLYLSRTVGRKLEDAGSQSRAWPWVLINDQYPKHGDKDYGRTLLLLMVHNVFILLITVISLQTLITQTYGGKNRVFGTLLAIRTIYMALACIEDCTQMDAAHGLPRRLPRQLMTFRAIFLMPATAIFTGWLVACANPWR